MDNIQEAFNKVRRTDFLPEETKAASGLDIPLPIGYGQTNSQPSTVENMLRWLEPEKNNKILDVGSGSGWTSALLAQIVGPNGEIYAVERIPELLEFGRRNIQNTGIKNVSFHKSGIEHGLTKHAPYDRILVSAGAQKLPLELIDQLTDRGKMVIPVKNDILEIEKVTRRQYEIKSHPGYIFVPLV